MNQNIPDLMPILSSGAHSSPAEGACVMEMASYLAGEAWSDRPTCTHPVLATVARHVNDSLGDDARQSLLPLLPRLMGTAETGAPAERHRLTVSLAVWCAEQVAHHTGGAEPESREAIRVTRAWLDGEATGGDAARAAAYAARAAADAAYADANAAANANAAATNAANAAANAADADYAADAAANAAYAAADAAAELLAGLIDEYDRLTGRTAPTQLSVADTQRLAQLTA